MTHMEWLRIGLVGACCAMTACGGGGGSSSAPPPGGGGGGTPPPPTTPPPITDVDFTGAIDLGLASGGFGLVDLANLEGIGLDIAIGGTGGLDIAIGGTGGLNLGTIDAFSSIVVNGDVIGTDNAQILINGETAQLTDLRQGQQVLVVVDLPDMESPLISYRPNVVAPIEFLSVANLELGLAAFTAFGQNILVNAATVFEGVDLATLQNGQTVEVSGLLAADGTLTATYIGLLVNPPEFQLSGQVQNLGAGGFTINGLSVDTSGATILNFPNDDILQDSLVEIRVTSAIGSPIVSVAADEVERLPRVAVGASTPSSIEGLVSSIQGDGTLLLQGISARVPAGSNLFNGEDDDIAVGVRLELSGDTDDDGVIDADDTFIQPDDTVVAEQVIEAIDDAAGALTVLSTPFVVRDLTEFDDVAGLSDLMVGDRVELVGFVDGAQVAAAEVELGDPLDVDGELRGLVTAVDAASNAITVFDVLIQSQTGITEFIDFDDNSVTQADFFNQISVGDFVEVQWDVFSNTDQVPDQLSLEDD